MPNKLTVDFEPCEANGYFFKYRVKGSDEPYRGNMAVRTPPALAYITEDRDGTQYEGYLQSFCVSFPTGITLGEIIYFETDAPPPPAVNHAEVGVGGVGTACFMDAVEVVYFTGVLGNGTKIYKDNALQQVYDTYSHIAYAGKKYSVNWANGVITFLSNC